MLLFGGLRNHLSSNTFRTSFLIEILILKNVFSCE